MATIFWKRLKEKYGVEDMKGGRYRKLMSEIVIQNNMKTGRAVGRLSNEHYKNSVKRLSKVNQKTIKLPPLDEVLPKRSVFIRKGADRGRMLSDSLRDKLNGTLRRTLNEYIKTGKPLIQEKGRHAGRINLQLIDDFKASSIETFKSSTRTDPQIGVPKTSRQLQSRK